MPDGFTDDDAVGGAYDVSDAGGLGDSVEVTPDVTVVPADSVDGTAVSSDARGPLDARGDATIVTPQPLDCMGVVPPGLTRQTIAAGFINNVPYDRLDVTRVEGVLFDIDGMQWPFGTPGDTGPIDVLVGNGRYVAYEFDPARSPSATGQIFQVPTSRYYYGVPTVSISLCPGDFGESLPPGCRLEGQGEAGIHWTVAGRASTLSPGFCVLDPTHHYYVNVTYGQPPDFTRLQPEPVLNRWHGRDNVFTFIGY